MKKYCHKTLALLLCLAMCISVLPVSAAAADVNIYAAEPETGEPISPPAEDTAVKTGKVVSNTTYSGYCNTGTGNTLKWSLNDATGVLTISGSGTMKDYTTSDHAPWYQYRSSITTVTMTGGSSIGNYAFYFLNKLTSISFPSTLKSVGSYAFNYCAGLTTVSFPSGVTTIGSWVFSDCSKLTNVTFPSTVTSLGSYVFYQCGSLQSVTLPTELTTINYGLFSHCTALTSVSIPLGVTTIQGQAFYDCASLKKVTIPSGVTEIGETAFCTSGITSITLPTGLKTLGYRCFASCKALESVTIPAGVTSFGENAFYGCTSLTSVSFGSGLTSIGSFTFGSCQKLSDITIPASVVRISPNAFNGCVSLRNIRFDARGGAALTIGENAFYTGPAEVATAVFVEDPNNVPAEIANYDWEGSNRPVGFYAHGETFLSAVEVGGVIYAYDPVRECYYVNGHNAGLPAAVSIQRAIDGYPVRDIGSFAFEGADGLSSVTIPSSVKLIGVKAFSGCSSLQSVSIPSGVTAIDNYAFDGCISLTNVTIPGSVTRIGSYTFNGCSALQSASIPSAVMSINAYTFNECSSLQSVTISSGVTSIGNYAFYKCTALTEITIPGNVEMIGEYAFYNCSSMTKATLSEGVVSLGKTAFYACSALTDVTIPSSVRSIGASCFGSCTSLKEIAIPEGVTIIESNSFNGCSKLASISIPASVTTISAYAFSSCGRLADVWFGGTQDQWESITVDSSNNTYLTKATIHYIGIADGTCGEGLTWLLKTDGTLVISGTGAMANYSIGGAPWYEKASQILAVEIGEGVTFVGENSLTNLGNMTAVTIPDSVMSIGYRAFAGCGSLQSVAIPAGVTVIGKSAFSGCSALTEVNIPAGVSTIDVSTFSNCIAMQSMTIPASVTSIGSYAFSDCTSLNQIIFIGSLPTLGIDAFAGVVATVLYPAGDESFEAADCPLDEYPDLTKQPYCSLDGDHTPGEPVQENVTEATCTAEGSYDEVVYCSVCHEELSREAKTVPATGHDWELSGWSWSEDCTTAAATFVCRNDESHSETVTAQVVSEQTTAPTCAAEGTATYTATAELDGETYTDVRTQALPKLEHTPGEAVHENEVAATCTAEGSYDEVVYCTVCHEELSRETKTVPATGHTPGEAVRENEVPATCTAEGSYDEVVYCTGCHEELSRETKTVPATGHTPGEAVHENEVAATCTTDGSYDEVVYCTVCHEELSRETKTVPATGHTSGEAVRENEVPATCTAEGSYDEVVYCTVCHEEVSREKKTIDKLPHTPGEAVRENEVAATCAQEGSYDEVVYCSVCGEKISEEHKTIEKLDHTPGEQKHENEKEPTCTEAGSYEEVTYCAVCGEEISRETVTDGEPLGHAYVLSKWNWDGYAAAAAVFECEHDGSHRETVPAEITAERTEPTVTTEGSVKYTATVVFEGRTYSDVKTEILPCLIQPPTITKQPVSVSAMEGTEAVFTTEATGEQLTYQWYQMAPKSTKWTKITTDGDKPELRLTAAMDLNDYKYYCVVSNPSGDAETEAVVLTVTPRPDAPTITGQPQSVTVVAGKPVTFTVTAQGEGLSYQWYRMEPRSTKWVKITENGNKAQYTFTAAMDMTGSHYYCEVSNITGSVDSEAAMLTVTAPTAPVITTQPAAKTVAAGKTVSFTVKAEGEGELAYQWYECKKGTTTWTPIEGATSAKLTFTAASTKNGNTYRCQVTADGDAERTATSTAVKLTVVTKPKVTTQPKSVSVKAGGKVTFKVKATGTGLKYQWYVMKAGTTKWVKMSGKTKATLSFTAKASQNGWKYQCWVKNIAGTVKSKAAKLTVK